jgi:predicted nuclease of predicted toxin-antitoxin system
MKFLVDAHLPQRLSRWLVKKGYDSIHTLELPAQNETDDLVIIDVSVNEQRIVISKDSDFVDYCLLKGKPYKLISITTGNITNSQLIQLFEQNFTQLIDLINDNKVIEMSNTAIIVHY